MKLKSGEVRKPPRGTKPVTDHPAKFSDAVLEIMEPLIPYGAKVLDPFMGVGKIFNIVPEAIGVDIEPEWAACHPNGLVGDATSLPADWKHRFDVIATSPTFGNRMADHHDAKEKCKPCGATGKVGRKKCEKCDGKGVRKYTRITYTHKLREGTGDPERTLHENNTGAMQWGDAYRQLHAEALAEMFRVLKPSRGKRESLLLLNMSDHYRKHERVEVVKWWIETAEKIGFVKKKVIKVETPRMGYGENRDARVENEVVVVFKRP